MISSAKRFIVTGTLVMTLITLPALTNVYAMGAGGGGGGGAGAGGAGAGAGGAGAGAGGAGAGAGGGGGGAGGGSYGGGYPYSGAYSGSVSFYSRPWGTRPIFKSKKTHRHPAF